MKPSAKQLTFLYFSMVAFAIIAIHASVFITTAEDMELLYAENRLNKIKEFVSTEIDEKAIPPENFIKIQTQGKAQFDPYVEVYFDVSDLPPALAPHAGIAAGEAYEVVNEASGKTYFVQKERFDSGIGEVFIVLDNSFYELTEEQLLVTHFKQVIISLALIAVSLLVVLKISERINRPITHLADDLVSRSAETLDPLKMPPGIITKEVHQLVESFNAYQERIRILMERERSFSRYASHELRSPLMVMKGAITLLGESDEKPFVEKQRKRLERATDEMNEFVQTLLSLTKLPSEQDVVPWQLSEEEVRDILQDHEHLLSGTQVKCEVQTLALPIIKMPAPTFRLLLGNLIKNAFAHTTNGMVRTVLSQKEILIIDTGKGLASKESAYEGFGLGLLLVNDICHQFGYEFSLTENSTGGCTAKVFLGSKPGPSSPL
jgi:signal transduction histidine kinase